MVEGLGGSGKGRVTRVVCSTFPRRGKSATLESRMEMEELRRWREDCRVVTLLWRGDVIVPSFPSDLPVARLCLRVKRRQNILLRIVVRVCVGVGVDVDQGWGGAIAPYGALQCPSKSGVPPSLTSTRAKRAAGQYDLVLLYIVCLVIYIGKLRNSEVNWCS